MDLEQQLFNTCKIGDFDKVKYLIKNGVDIHVKNSLPLILAAKNGNLKVVKFLVKKGADINAENGKVLHLALTGKHFKIAEFLWENGINFNLNEELHWAFKNNDFETVNYLSSLCIKKAKVLKIMSEKLSKEDKRSVIKKTIVNQDLDLDTKFFKQY